MARDMLVRAAATKWSVAAAECTVENGVITHQGKKTTFGAVAKDAQALVPPTSVTLKPAAEWKRIGKPTKRLDSPEKVTGKAQFGMDVQFPGLMTALIARPPVFGGTVKSFDAGAAKAVAGVKAVVQVPSGVAVIAEHFWAAKTGRDALKVDWDLGPGATLDSDALSQEYRRLCATPGAKAAAAGDLAAAPPSARPAVDAEYELPFLAHAPMEPLNCTVKVTADGCDIWTGTQFQTGDQASAAAILGLKPEQVRLHTTFLGGGFGRRATASSDFVVEAAQVAKAAGLPVKVVWTREDDIKGGYYRPQWMHKVTVHAGAKGLPQRWEHAIAGQSFMIGTPFEAMMVKDGVDGVAVEGVADSPYLKAVPVHRVGLHIVKIAAPTLWWRSVGHSHTAFVMESVIDELAHAAKQDPLEYRRALLHDHPRHLGVLNLAAEKAGWGKPLPKGRAMGLAVHESFGSWVAQVAEVSMDGNRPRVHRVVCAVDCGIVVNPEGVRAQLESGVAFGLSAALHGRITFKAGRVEQSNFHDYQVLRLPEMPVVEVHIVPSTQPPGGVGEPGTPPAAPAVSNAIFRLTGKRVRRLPFDLATA
jgi:isoquinoline 1-oxidoreductase beta subunit